MTESTVVSGASNKVYDEVPYESYPYFHSHPDRLATMAKLFGMNPAPVEKCRVLELGCASGGNLIPSAYTLPESQFTGVDLSSIQVADGKKMIDALGLKNIELKHMSIKDVNKDMGEFDYIISHGVYSWVPDDVQEAMLRICQENLAPQGVAYISYNVFPGWHFRGMIRDMMMYHTAPLQDPAQRASQARALLDFLSQSVPTQGNAYGLMLKDELEMLKTKKDYYLLHDHLEELNTPVYFHDFVRRANNHKLQFLSEADLAVMLTSNLPKQIGETLTRISNEIVRTEQYMDFVRNKQFRQTLLCRQDITLNRNLSPSSVMSFYMASPIKPLSDAPNTFAMPDGRTITTNNPLVKAALEILSQTWPQSIHFDELLSQSYGRLNSLAIKDKATLERESQILAADLLMMNTSNLLVMRSSKAPFVTTLSDHPKVSDLVRYQAKQGLLVTSQLHDVATLDVLGQNLVELCDGTRSKTQILDGLVERVKQGVLNVHKDGKLLTDQAQIREAVEPMMEQALQNMRNSAIVIA